MAVIVEQLLLLIDDLHSSNSNSNSHTSNFGLVWFFFPSRIEKNENHLLFDQLL